MWWRKGTIVCSGKRQVVNLAQTKLVSNHVIWGLWYRSKMFKQLELLKNWTHVRCLKISNYLPKVCSLKDCPLYDSIRSHTPLCSVVRAVSLKSPAPGTYTVRISCMGLTDRTVHKNALSAIKVAANHSGFASTTFRQAVVTIAANHLLCRHPETLPWTNLALISSFWP